MLSFTEPFYFPQQTLNQRTFIATTTYAGVTIPIYSTTSPTFGLWNPLGSEKNVVLLRLNVGVSDSTAPVVTSLGLAYVANTGSTAATGAPVAAITETQPVCGLVGATPSHASRFTLSATLTSAASYFYALGTSQATTSAANGLLFNSYDFQGDIVIPPGTFIHLVGAPVAPGVHLGASLVFTEIDVTN